MATPRNPIRFDRRSLLKLAGAASASVAAGVAWVREASAARRGFVFNIFQLTTVPIYRLSTDCESTECDHQTEIRTSCNTCKACLNHAHFKRWATLEAVWRAHDCCRCSIQATRVPKAVFDGMFGTGAGFTPEFDSRSL